MIFLQIVLVATPLILLAPEVWIRWKYRNRP
jgi:hypothetical protein